MEESPQELTTLVGLEVYSKNGVYVGTIEDLRLNLDTEAVTGLALADVNMDLFDGIVGRGQGLLIPYRWVRTIGDIVIIVDTVERLGSPDNHEEIVA